MDKWTCSRLETLFNILNLISLEVIIYFLIFTDYFYRFIVFPFVIFYSRLYELSIDYCDLECHATLVLYRGSYFTLLLYSLIWEPPYLRFLLSCRGIVFLRKTCYLRIDRSMISGFTRALSFWTVNNTVYVIRGFFLISPLLFHTHNYWNL